MISERTMPVIGEPSSVVGDDLAACRCGSCRGGRPSPSRTRPACSLRASASRRPGEVRPLRSASVPATPSLKLLERQLVAAVVDLEQQHAVAAREVLGLQQFDIGRCIRPCRARCAARGAMSWMIALAGSAGSSSPCDAADEMLVGADVAESRAAKRRLALRRSRCLVMRASAPPATSMIAAATPSAPLPTAFKAVSLISCRCGERIARPKPIVAAAETNPATRGPYPAPCSEI